MVRSIFLLNLIFLTIGLAPLVAQNRPNLGGTNFSISSQTGSYSVLAEIDGSFKIQDGQLVVTVNQGSIRLVNSDPDDTRPRLSSITAGLAVSKGRGNFWDMTRKSKRLSLTKKSADGETFLLENVTFAIPLPDNRLPLSSYWLVFQVEDSVVDAGTRLTGTYYVQSDRTIFAKL